MPDFYPPGEYDLAGFIVGVVDKPKVIDGKSIVPGDVVLGIPSTGLQTNGYSLARKLFFEVGGYKPDDHYRRTRLDRRRSFARNAPSFLPQLGPLLDTGLIKGLAHITGGGFLENIPRILPEGVSVEINRGTWPELPIFGLMQKLGNVEKKRCFGPLIWGSGWSPSVPRRTRTSFPASMRSGGQLPEGVMFGSEIVLRLLIYFKCLLSIRNGSMLLAKFKIP